VFFALLIIVPALMLVYYPNHWSDRLYALLLQLPGYYTAAGAVTFGLWLTLPLWLPSCLVYTRYRKTPIAPLHLRVLVLIWVAQLLMVVVTLPMIWDWFNWMDWH
jgi:hypothetical protein